MKKKALLVGSVVVAAGIFTGCGNEIKMSDYQNRVKQVVSVPSVCQAEYQSLKDIPTVAIVKFTNNSSFSKANVNNTSVDAKLKESLAAATNGQVLVAGHKAKYSKNSNTVQREVDPKLDKAITSALEGTLAQMGGANVYSRTDLAKVMKEQKLQQSGLFDEKTLVKVGKLAGVKYIITGSIDGVTQEYKDYTQAAKTVTQNRRNQRQDLTTMAIKGLINFGASAASGMKITTTITFKVIDVTTGKIVFSKQVKETKNIGKIQRPTYTQVIGGIKSDISDSLKGLKPELSEFFTLSGYITQIKTGKEHKKFIAQINLGTADKIKEGQTFSVYKFDSLIDPLTHKESCDKSKMTVKLTVSKNQIQLHDAWTLADGDDANQMRLGQIVKRDALQNSMFSF